MDKAKREMTASEAVEGSLKKWYGIRSGVETDKGEENCDLCKKYRTSFGCGDCLIAEKSESSNCSGTPYSEWREHIPEVHNHPVRAHKIELSCSECLKIAEEEIEYIKALRPLAIERDMIEKRPIHSPDQVLSMDDLVVGGVYRKYGPGISLKHSFEILSKPYQRKLCGEMVWWVDTTDGRERSIADMGLAMLITNNPPGWSKNWIEPVDTEKEKITELEAIIEEQKEKIEFLRKKVETESAKVKRYTSRISGAQNALKGS
jgi:hypothetical protein